MRASTITSVAAGFAILIVGCSKSRSSTADTSIAAATPPATDSTATSSTATGNVASAASVTVAQSPKFGSYLTDAAGAALYMFEKDKKGESYCDSACAAAWPPYIAAGAPAAGDSSVKSAMLSTIRRKDGSQQVAYNGMPLYHFARDSGAGSTKGQDVKAFGADWYLVSPSGKKQEGKE